MDAVFAALLNQEVAGFRLTAWVGEGGMTGVFRGENVLNPGIVRAIKVVRPEIAAKPEFVKRFAQEAIILEKLQHPNIVRFYGLRSHGAPPGPDLLLMELELLEGESLAHLRRRSRAASTVKAIVEWLAAAAEGVGAAHAAGIVHRDLKPENVFLTQSGHIKVLDFGIAKALEESEGVEAMTQAGMVLGTVGYMAPEVCMGKTPDARADVYALGLSALELLMGEHPFIPRGGPRPTLAQLMMAHVQRDLPAVRQVRPDAPPLLEQVVTRATAKDPSWRYPNASDLAQALRAVIDDLGANAPAADAVAPIGTQFALPPMFAPSSDRSSIPLPTPSSGGAPVPQGTPVSGATPLQAGNAAQISGQVVSLSSQATTPLGGAPAPKSRGLLVGGAVLGVVAIVAAVFALRHGGATPDEPSAAAGPSAAASASAAGPATSAAPPAPPSKNRWIRVDAPGASVTLGLANERVPAAMPGFRPSRKITAPTAPFEMLQHEVTWDELDEWLAAHPDLAFKRPEWVPSEPPPRAKLPATGVPWDTARAYCRDLGGQLPSEEEWEYAARGPQRRPYPWGRERVDLARTRAYKRDGNVDGPPPLPVTEVMSNDQDQTPADPGDGVFDLLGNAQEWTRDLYREDLPSKDESWVEEGGMTFRAVRGLPLDAPQPKKLPEEGAAVRQALCATGPCPKAAAEVTQYVGFRCARRIKGGSK